MRTDGRTHARTHARTRASRRNRRNRRNPPSPHLPACLADLVSKNEWMVVNKPFPQSLIWRTISSLLDQTEKKSGKNAGMHNLKGTWSLLGALRVLDNGAECQSNRTSTTAGGSSTSTMRMSAAGSDVSVVIFQQGRRHRDAHAVLDQVEPAST